MNRRKLARAIQILGNGTAPNREFEPQRSGHAVHMRLRPGASQTTIEYSRLVVLRREVGDYSIELRSDGVLRFYFYHVPDEQGGEA